ncbi:CDP-glycerol glycerophosphotransferase family protein [Anoxynatronum buryatiense]|uniref:CDP-glycerol glycerophosphotransferase, TagB/SpsB family n=1 Tax=Anoxynatronum buryatiense TaxID=489973 RepID=A0AA45WY76_9CLOT|nr:CDP-glycerol glycerophosphotransferase family protein [Anoxynatronum buryatiense]SMP67508.1 CDP-glycerol glycerophosphotransferase, TagB/SpsB family [Anoxynatronum buryatiense]
MNDQIIIFGASTYGKKLLKLVEEEYANIVFCDNDKAKWDQVFEGKRVISPNQILNQKNARIIIASQYSGQIAQQLINMGFKKFEVLLLNEIREGRKSSEFLARYNYEGVTDWSIQSNKVCLISRNDSGSSTTALYNNQPDFIKDRFEVYLVKENTRCNDYFYHLLTASVVVTTHGPVACLDGQLLVECWHGFPLKTVGNTVANHQEQKKTRTQWNQLSLMASYSSLYGMAMKLSFDVDETVLRNVGMPRNDWLFLSEGMNNLKKLVGVKSCDTTKVLFAPTFRKSFYGYDEETTTKPWSNVFGFHDYSEEKMEAFLKKYQIELFVKVHPLEEPFWTTVFTNQKHPSQVTLLRDEDFTKNSLDFYEILNAFDMLITDYSSVYFDFLLLDRPLIFTPVDIAEYQQKRGFLLEPYDVWAPGAKVTSQSELMIEMKNLIIGEDHYSKQRDWVKRVVHEKEDEKASLRLWHEIQHIMISR